MRLQKFQIPTLFLLLLLLLNTSKTSAQNAGSNDFSKNVIHGSLGTFLVINSGQITYDRLLSQKDKGFFKSYYLTLKAGGHFTVDFSGNDSGTGYVTSLGVTALTGSNNKHFEVGLGIGYFIDTENLVDEGDPTADVDESTFYPNISIGYRKQTTQDFMFRAGIGIVEWAYVGFGYSF